MIILSNSPKINLPSGLYENFLIENLRTHEEISASYIDVILVDVVQM